VNRIKKLKNNGQGPTKGCRPIIKMIKSKKVKISLFQAVEAHRVARD
jgi:hypothetical protein